MLPHKNIHAQQYSNVIACSSKQIAEFVKWVQQQDFYDNTTLDLYPTTLSSLGVEIEGSRLGLGVDLYSSEPTLTEKYGVGYLDTELLKNSDYYSKKLLYKGK